MTQLHDIDQGLKRERFRRHVRAVAKKFGFDAICCFRQAEFCGTQPISDASHELRTIWEELGSELRALAARARRHAA